MDFLGTPILRQTQVDAERCSIDLLTGPTGNQSLANTRFSSFKTVWQSQLFVFKEGCKYRLKRHVYVEHHGMVNWWLVIDDSERCFMFCRRELGKALPSYGRISSSSLTLHCKSLCITHIILQFTSHYNPFYIKLHMNRLGSTTSQDSMTSTDSMGWMTALACWKKAETSEAWWMLDGLMWLVSCWFDWT